MAPWHTKLLHYRGQLNLTNRDHENYGGVIDPSMIQDPTTGQRYLFWAEQHTSIWAAKLSANGLNLGPQVRRVLWIRHGWECNRQTCTMEGPEEYYTDGWFYLFYSSGSTWKGTYAVGLAVGTDPLAGEFMRLNQGQPILTSGHGWLGPGGTSSIITGANGQPYLFYHAETAPNPSHDSADRYLMMSPVNWSGLGDFYPAISGGRP